MNWRFAGSANTAAETPPQVILAEAPEAITPQTTPKATLPARSIMVTPKRLRISFVDRLKIWFEDHPLALMATIPILFLMPFFVWHLHNEASARYTEFTGTVCCLSDAYFVESEQSKPLKMMIVDLDIGRRVEVPVMHAQFYVPYHRNGRIIIRRVTNKSGPHPRYIAVRYLK
ncbi:hypothetical protein NCG89_08725 [Spongiibacter taiwanensis]|uniref:hypothetical protein n=1 Tax=Spongiibacter taiwanensis TaxID=1748242 RepID=UPI0020361245|nr:hypothetical protein [Spongiibacter taiwanensis]USA41603.1 hypothetical protein NCG89_08725 [Spongiibacter taiwanensis]